VRRGWAKILYDSWTGIIGYAKMVTAVIATKSPTASRRPVEKEV
jgi:hypothetical protein